MGKVSKDSSDTVADTIQPLFSGPDLTETGGGNLQILKNTLDRFQFYMPVFRYSLINSNLSNNGTAWQNLNFNPYFTGGFDPGFHTFDIYYTSLSEVSYYDVRSPFTRAQYIQGPQEEINFRILHTRNIGKPVNFGINYQRIASDGILQKQSSNHNNLQLHAWFRPIRSGYQALVAAVYHNGICQENGGITAKGDSIYRSDSQTNFTLLPVNLTEASNKIFRNGFFIRQRYDFNKKNRDSADISRFFGIQHTFSYRYAKHTFADKLLNPAYYAEIFDSSRVWVSYEYRITEQETAILRASGSNDTSRKFHVDFKAFFKQQFVSNFMPFQVLEQSYNLKTTNQIAGGFLKFRSGRFVQISMSGMYVLSGFNKADFDAKTLLNIGPAERWVIQLGGERYRQEADYQMQRFVSNFSVWNNDFEKIIHTRLFAGFYHKKSNVDLQFSNHLVNQFVYMGIQGKPDQMQERAQILQASADHRLHFGRWHLYSRALYQFCNKKEIIRLPEIQIQESFFYEGKLKGKTSYRIGIDFMAASDYLPSAYQPFSGLFMLQDQIKNKTFYQADFYISAKIKTVLAFLKLENVSSLWDREFRIPVTGYPLNRMAFKIGLSWMFYD